MPDVLNWRTSSYTRSDSCVEVADNHLSRVMVRDTKHGEFGHLSLGPASWSRFIEATKQVPQSHDIITCGFRLPCREGAG
ncbi:DUF397 domain-containing protein [Streptomyces sp. NPDC040750]|uniref:DUF397 domain-containing protein n=1 Tax=Streptomyces sp. NPDC040750 TaxID=3154491 RepID=UPI0033E61495